MAQWRHMVTWIWINIGSGNGLLPDGTKPLPEPMLTYHQRGSVAFSSEQFHRKCSRYQFVKQIWIYNFKIISTFSRGQWVKSWTMLVKRPSVVIMYCVICSIYLVVSDRDITDLNCINNYLIKAMGIIINLSYQCTEDPTVLIMGIAVTSPWMKY